MAIAKKSLEETLKAYQDENSNGKQFIGEDKEIKETEEKPLPFQNEELTVIDDLKRDVSDQIAGIFFHAFPQIKILNKNTLEVDEVLTSKILNAWKKNNILQTITLILKKNNNWKRRVSICFIKGWSI